MRLSRTSSFWKTLLVPVLLVLCTVVVGMWQVAGWLSARRGSGLGLSGAAFSNFIPDIPGLRCTVLPVVYDPLVPNVFVCRVHVVEETEAGTKISPTSGLTLPHTVLFRVVHGYNMVDCMRIKGYEVEEIVPGSSFAVPGSSFWVSPRESTPGTVGDRGDQQLQNQEPGTKNSPPSSIQIWRVTSAIGDRSIWVTSMVRAHDLAMTDIDTRSMAFPRVGIPDDPNWVPRGLTLASLRHPVAGLRTYLRSRWNSSRCDLLTFLGLRRPAWVSDDLFTLVSAWEGGDVSEKREQDVIGLVTRVQVELYDALERWWNSPGEVSSRGVRER